MRTKRPQEIFEKTCRSLRKGPTRMSGRRCRHDIAASLLEALAKGVAKPSRLAVAANTSYKRVRKLLDTMREHGLVALTEEGYTITERGYAWLRLYQMLLEIYDPPPLD